MVKSDSIISSQLLVIDPMTKIIKAYANKMGKEWSCSLQATHKTLIKLLYVIKLCQNITFNAAGI